MLHIFALSGGTHVIISQILCKMSYQTRGRISVMTSGRHISVSLTSPSMTYMPVIAELCTSSVIYQQDTHIGRNMSVAQDIHVVEERKISDGTEKQTGIVCQRCSDKRGHVTVNAKSPHIRSCLHRSGQFKEIPCPEGIKNSQSAYLPSLRRLKAGLVIWSSR